MSARQLDMIGKPARKMRGQLMHVCDAGCGDSAPIAQLQCQKCGHRSGWLKFDTVTEAKRGLPCPKCKPESRS